MERGGVENTKKKGMAGERGWCLKTPGGFERGLDLSDTWLKLNWPARAPARQVCVLLGELDAGLLLMDTLEIALVIGELNLLLQILAGLLVAKVIAGSLSLVQLVQNLKLVLLNQSLASSAASAAEDHDAGWEGVPFLQPPPGQTVEEWVDFLTHYQADFIADLDVAHVAHT